MTTTEAKPISARRTSALIFLAVTLPLLLAYLPTATWRLPYHIDPGTNALTAWYLGNQGTVVMTEHREFTEPAYFGVLAWLVNTPNGPVSQYPPGAAALAAPLYALGGGDLTYLQVTASNDPDLGPVTIPIPPLWPATLAAVLATALAAGFLALALEPMVGRRWAGRSGLMFGLATGAWAVAADMLWTHGPALLWIASGLFLSSRGRYGWAGLALGAAVLTRPHLAVVAAAMGLAAGVAQRKALPVIKMGAGSGAGFGALVAYNWAVFGRPGIRGGYAEDFTERLVGADIGAYLANIWGALFDLSNGLLVWAPFLFVLIVGVPSVWRRVPAWAIGAAVGGVLYLLIQLKANRFSGGDGHFAYRYPLETLMACAPLLVVSARNWAWERGMARRLLAVTTLLAVGGQAFGAITTFIP